MNSFVFVCNFVENSKTALSVALMGMITIFVVLALLWGAIELFRAIYLATQNKEKKSIPEKEAAQEATTPVVAVESEPVYVQETDEAEIVAAISAALAAYLDVPQSSFRVVSFKKVANGAHWNK